MKHCSLCHMAANVFASVALLLVGSASGSSCLSGLCTPPDETTLMQIEQHVKYGHSKAYANMEHRAAQEQEVDHAYQSSLGWTERLQNEIVFELSAPTTPPPVKNKFILAVIECFFLSACLGVDRCYMGQCCCGVLKACTFGGFGVWVVVDFLIWLYNSLTQATSIHSLGLVAEWDEGTITPSFILSLIMVTCWCSSWCYSLYAAVAGANDEAKDDSNWGNASADPMEAKNLVKQPM